MKYIIIGLILLSLSFYVIKLKYRLKDNELGNSGSASIVGTPTPTPLQSSIPHSGGGGEGWTEIIRRENPDGTYYFVYREHMSGVIQQ